MMMITRMTIPTIRPAMTPKDELLPSIVGVVGVVGGVGSVVVVYIPI